MEVKKNIFEKLADKKICYSVGISLKTYANKAIDWNTKEFFIVIHKRDFHKLQKCRFVQRTINKQVGRKKKVIDNPNLYERLLFPTEIKLFKSMIADQFTKVLHCAHGRMYELKDNSFKKYYDNYSDPIEVNVKQVA